MRDPFEHMTEADFLEALKLENWEETRSLHTLNFDATLLEGGRLLFVFHASGNRYQLERSEVEALTRFLSSVAQQDGANATD